MSSTFSYNAPPPTRFLAPARPISPSTTLEYLEKYLTASETQAHLTPNFSFSDRNISIRAGGLGEAIQIRNLRRIAAGLRGEWLGATTDEDLFSSSLGVSQPLSDGVDIALEDSAAVTTQALSGADDVEDEPVDGWDGVGGEGDITTKSYGEQMREQGEKGIVEGEIGERNNVVWTPSSQKKQKKRKRENVEVSAADAEAPRAVDDAQGNYLEAPSVKRHKYDAQNEGVRSVVTTTDDINGNRSHTKKAKKRKSEVTANGHTPNIRYPIFINGDHSTSKTHLEQERASPEQQSSQAAPGAIDSSTANQSSSKRKKHRASDEEPNAKVNSSIKDHGNDDISSSKKPKKQSHEDIGTAQVSAHAEDHGADLVNGHSSSKKSSKRRRDSHAERRASPPDDIEEHVRDGGNHVGKTPKRQRPEAEERDSTVNSKASLMHVSSKTPQSDRPLYNVTPNRSGTIDKKARKLAKKQRRKEEKRVSHLAQSGQKSVN